MPKIESTKPSQLSATGPSKPKNAADKLIEMALQFKGLPYKWGGGHGGTFSKPGPVDCSGLIQQAARMAGIANFDGTAATQQDMGKKISPVTPDNLKPGDFVTMGNPAHHIGIYIGNNQVVHSPKTGDVVKISPLTGYGWDGANRVFDEAGQPAEGQTVDNAPASGGAPGGAGSGGGGDSASMGGGGRPSGMSLPSGSGGGGSGGGSAGGGSGGGGSAGGGGASGGGGVGRSGGSSGASGPSGTSGGYTPKVDWDAILNMAATEGNLSQSDAEAFIAMLKNGNHKGAKKLLKDKGLSDAKADKLMKNALDKSGRQAAIAAILNDAEIQQAFKDWHRLSTEQKLKIGAKISEIQGQAMGFTPAPLSRDPNLAKAGQAGTYGLWNSRNGIGISDAALASPAMFLNTVVHEQAHKMNWQNGKAPSASHDSGQDAVYDIGNDFEQAVFGSRSLNGIK